MGRKSINILGRRFGRLTVIERVEPSDGKKLRWKCVCDCGGGAISYYSDLASGHSLSCGCVQRERARAAKTTHGQSGSPEHRSWKAMWTRVTNSKVPNYKDYGGRGIAVCDRWLLFENFYADMGDRPAGTSLDRIDNSRGYEPGNCRWADRKTQNSNRRSNKIISLNGESRTLSEWSRLSGVDRHTIMKRIMSGARDEEVIAKRRNNS